MAADLARLLQGTLFTRDFLVDAIKRTRQYQALTAQDLTSFRNTVSQIIATFPVAQTPNETQTEDDLIWPVLRALGWQAHLRNQNLSVSGREDVPDGLLFADEAAKNTANESPEEWRRYRHGLAIVEAKRWQRPLDRRSGRRDEDETAPSTQMLRYLRRVDTITEGKVRWAILTNGGRWRLYYQGAKSVSDEFCEIDLPAALGLAGDAGLFALTLEEQDHWLRVFLLVFGKASFLPQLPDARTFHLAALEEGKFYEERVAQNLSSLVFDQAFPALSRAIATSAPDAELQEVREAALILLYRLLFILYAEDRDLLPVRDPRFDDYSLRERVRMEVGRQKDNGHAFSTTATRYWSAIDDLCRAIDGGDGSIGLPPYNGGLFDAQRTPLLTRVRIPDAVLADVVDVLSFERVDGQRRYINYRDLSVQQLGSIYERLLEFELAREGEAITVRPNTFARKRSGSYYTPEALVGVILHETLEPLVAERLEAFRERAEALSRSTDAVDRRLGALRRSDPAEALLELRFCDPAMGSGHFLVSLVDMLTDHVIAAMAEAEQLVDWGDYRSPLAHRIDDIRTRIVGNAEDNNWSVDVSQLDDRHIVRRMVLKRCVYGVDKNPMAVELSKVSLWLHTFTVGAPLSFLDHHLRCGDSLFGLTVRRLSERLTKKWQTSLLIDPALKTAMGSAAGMQLIEGLTDAEIAEAHRSKELWDGVLLMVEPLDAFMKLIHALDWLDIKHNGEKSAVQSYLDGLFGDPFEIARGKLDVDSSKRGAAEFRTILDRARQLIAEERFLNWETAFPGVWRNWSDGDAQGGFDAVIGNPPWDRMKMQEVEWFAARRADIAHEQRAADRKRLVAALKATGDPLHAEYEKASGRADDALRIAKASGEYPLLSGGDVNIYSLFVERASQLIRPTGLVGFLTPIGIGADKTSAKFFSKFADEERIKCFISFENRRGWLFPDVHHEDQPTIIAFGGQQRTFSDFKFAVKLSALPSPKALASMRRLTGRDCKKINPNTGTVPIFRSERDASITSGIYSRLPVYVDRSIRPTATAWPVKYATKFHMTNDSRLFRTKEALENGERAYPEGCRSWRSQSGAWLPLFEGKMISNFNHRYSSVGINPRNVSGQGVALHSTEEQLRDPAFCNQPRFWVSESEVSGQSPYALGFNDVCNTNNSRSLIAAVVPRAAYGNKLPVLEPVGTVSANDFALMLATLNSIVCDYVARQKIQSRNLNKYILEQLPVPTLEAFSMSTFGSKSAHEIICPAVLELTYCSRDLEAFAKDMGHMDRDGTAKAPFAWDARRRAHLQAKLDAVFFHLYGVTDRDDVTYIYSTFGALERNETRTHGRFLSKELGLHYFNALASGQPDAEVRL